MAVLLKGTGSAVMGTATVARAIPVDTIAPVMDGVQLLYIYDGSLEGMFTAVFEAFRRKEDPVNIVEDGFIQQSLLHSHISIKTDPTMAERVRTGLIDKLGLANYERIIRGFLSDDCEKGGILYRYIRYTMRNGGRSCLDLAHPAVADFENLQKQVSNEAHHMLMFIRFAQLENGVYFSQIDPRARVVPLIMDHFAARFNVQPFIVYDRVHGMAGVFDTEKWWMVDANEIQLPGNSQLEDDFRSLWQTFYDTIAIEERRNPTCQRNFMPKRFWGNMCEHIPVQLRNNRPTTATPTQVAKQAARALPGGGVHAGAAMPEGKLAAQASGRKEKARLQVECGLSL